MENVNNQFEKRDSSLRKNIFNRFDVRKQSGGFVQNSTRYNDSPMLDENVLKEMAGAYASVLSKYGYTVQPNNKLQRMPNLPNPNNNCINSSEYKSEQIKNQAKETQEELKTNIAGEKSTNQTFDNNMDYLSNQYLLPDTNYTFSQLQITNELLMQILNELKTITCLIDCNRRRRLS